jgi:CheY-like chemotaxis protein
MTTDTDSKCRVLLVEDEALIAMLMEDMLAEFACEVAIAGSQDFDMAFVDVNLRGVPAWPLAEVLRGRGIPFAFVTGYGAAGTAGAHPDVPVLQKPFRSQDLEAIVQRLRAHHSSADA